MYDAIVVGSGFGGTMAAHRLVEAGWNVLLLERGARVQRGPHNRQPRATLELTPHYSRESAYKVIEGGVLAPEARKGRLEDHIYVFGGEERFWLGPEGGQFAIFFAPGASIRHVSRTIHISGDET